MQIKINFEETNGWFVTAQSNSARSWSAALLRRFWPDHVVSNVFETFNASNQSKAAKIAVLQDASRLLSFSC